MDDAKIDKMRADERYREFRIRLDRFEKAVLEDQNDCDDVIGKRKHEVLALFVNLSYEYSIVLGELTKANRRIEKLETDVLASELKEFGETNE